MLSEAQLKEIQEHWRELGPVEAHYPGCYKDHMGCAIDALIHDLRYWREHAQPRLETRQVGPQENPREKELLAVCENLVELLRITFSASSEAYLRAVDIVRVAKGLPPEGEYPAAGDQPPKKKQRKKNPPQDVQARWDYPELEGEDQPPPKLP